MEAFEFIQASFPDYYAPRFKSMVLSRDKAKFSDVSSLRAMHVFVNF